MAWVEKDHNAHPVSTPFYVQGRQPADQAAQSHIQPGLGCLQGWGIHNLLGQPVPVRHHPLCEQLPPNIQPKPLLSQFKTIPPCPITIHPREQSFTGTVKIRKLEDCWDVGRDKTSLRHSSQSFLPTAGILPSAILKSLGDYSIFKNLDNIYNPPKQPHTSAYYNYHTAFNKRL